jgi:hypothetical protein
MSYAVETEVPVEKSQAEIQRMLMKAGATKFAVGFEADAAAIHFQLKNKYCRFVLPLPDRAEERFWFTAAKKLKRNENEAFRAWEQACRSRWRALALAIKAKLESVEIGLTSFEQEFLAFIVTEDGRTIGERVIPQLEEATANGRGPQFQLTFGGGR